MSERLVRPEPPDKLTQETREFWREMGREMVRGSIDTMDGTARQIIAVAGILEGLYFHAIAFSDLRGQVMGGPQALYVAPILLLLLSLVAAFGVFFPERRRLNIHSSEGSRETYERVVASKWLVLRIAALCLVLALLAILAAVLVYLGG